MSLHMSDDEKNERERLRVQMIRSKFAAMLMSPELKQRERERDLEREKARSLGERTKMFASDRALHFSTPPAPAPALVSATPTKSWWSAIQNVYGGRDADKTMAKKRKRTTSRQSSRSRRQPSRSRRQSSRSKKRRSVSATRAEVC